MKIYLHTLRCQGIFEVYNVDTLRLGAIESQLIIYTFVEELFTQEIYK